MQRELPKMRSPRPSLALAYAVCGLLTLGAGCGAQAQATGTRPLRERLDAPLLFVKRHAYMAGHIYDDYYTWRPGGGIYVVENPWDSPEAHKTRALIDPNTPESLGEGVYRDPELSWDAGRIVFAFKGGRDDSTSIHEIGIDGTGLRRLTFPDQACPNTRCEHGQHFPGHHDVTPCYLPDGRIVFTSTRPRARVPCFNSGVDVLHVMDPDGGNIRCLSVNNVNEFDPAVLPDGRILFGRWEYVDKTALYMQSLWTVLPDGSNETALFGNNLAKPTAILDARPIPGSHRIVASLTPHNGQAVGAIAVIDPRVGKNDLRALTNLTPEYKTEMDQGLKRGPSDPWPISEELFLISNNADGNAVVQVLAATGQRETLLSDPAFCCYSPMLVKPRQPPLRIAAAIRIAERTGRFSVLDVYRGLVGIERGTIKQLRVIEETSRVSGIPPGGRWWNQAFLISWQGAYTVKNILGTVPVHADGSAYFELPVGQAVYFQALDASGRAVQSMRTFIQAVPGTTRSCIGCHESRMTAPPNVRRGSAQQHEPVVPEREPWGSGYLDYASMVQPILDRHCVSCHGGEKGIAAGIDLSGGWTWAFNISYETLLKNTLTGFLNCHNGSVRTAEVLPPNTHGSGAAPLAELLLAGHNGRLPALTRAGRDTILAWMDTNCNYYGTWDRTQTATCEAVLDAGGRLVAAMRTADCLRCHAPVVGNDWVNLRRPEMSRILRAPLGAGGAGFGLAWCRDRKAKRPPELVTQRQQPPDVFAPRRSERRDPSGDPVAAFSSVADPHYQAMLSIIDRARAMALSRPRIDMPDAELIAGQCRSLTPRALPVDMPLLLSARTEADGLLRLLWPCRAALVGLEFELFRGVAADPVPGSAEQVGTTTSFSFLDPDPKPGPRHYALVVTNGVDRSQPARLTLDVSPPRPLSPPLGLNAEPVPGGVSLTWRRVPLPGTTYDIYRLGQDERQKLNRAPLKRLEFTDTTAPSGTPSTYAATATDRLKRASALSNRVAATPLELPQDPVFVLRPDEGDLQAERGSDRVAGRLHGNAGSRPGLLDLTAGGHATFAHHETFGLTNCLTLEFRIRIDKLEKMPVVLAFGNFNRDGWFIQAFVKRWRWHLAGVSCDGGKVETGKWVHIAATYDRREARLYQDGTLVASKACPPELVDYKGALVIGQYTQRSPLYQVFGSLKDLRVYHRPLPAAEIAAHAQD